MKKLQQAINDVYEMLADASIYSSEDELRSYIERSMDILEPVYEGEK